MCKYAIMKNIIISIHLCKICTYANIQNMQYRQMCNKTANMKNIQVHINAKFAYNAIMQIMQNIHASKYATR